MFGDVFLIERDGSAAVRARYNTNFSRPLASCECSTEQTGLSQASRDSFHGVRAAKP